VKTSYWIFSFEEKTITPDATGFCFEPFSFSHSLVAQNMSFPLDFGK